VSDTGSTPKKRRRRNTDRGGGDAIGSAKVAGIRTNARGVANTEHYRCPPEIAYILENGERYGGRFTSFHWVVLVMTWRSVSGYHTPRWVAHRLGEKPAAVGQAIKSATRIAYEIVYRYEPALEKWHRGEDLTKAESNILRKYKYQKKGRKVLNIPDSDTLSGFSALSGYTKRQLGLDPDEKGS